MPYRDQGVYSARERQNVYNRGFEVAVGSGGIRALKPITTPNSSQWLGSPTDFDPRWHLQCDKACITSRLVSDVEIDALEFTFDQYKMISIAIGKRVSIAENKSLQDDFRQNALWYPHIPPPNLCLNEGSFMGEDPLISGYQPAYWTLFGGSDGHELAHLTAISVDMLSYRMKFFYQDGQLPCVTFRLGYDPSGFIDEYFIDEYFIEKESMFFIDGPGGERIDSLQVAVQVPTSDQNPHHRFKQGVPLRYKISTNRGRSLSLKDPRKYGEQYEQTLQTLSYERLDPAPGTTVVGFYAVQNYENEILSLGVISVAIEG
ncbi:hypothetical protein DTO027B9_5597 [Paecilomyces variotii]|nr:hypothetical protein DTO027B9_5597 [Paecilomyces variotii]